MINRRKLLYAGVSVVGTSIVTPAMAWFQGSNGTLNFRGNPNVIITGVETSGGIEMSRTSGNTPAFVHVSASNITATGTSYPFRDLEYSWNFGDPSGTENFINPVTGGNVNANRDQVGPEAAYVYRSAGAYTITLYIRYWDGSQFQKISKTATFIVSAYRPASGTFYFDSNYDRSHGASDGSITKPYTDYATLRTKSNSGSINLKLKYGSTFTSASGASWVVGQGGARMEAYGDPSLGRPIIHGVNIPPGHATLWFTNQFVDNDNCVYSNIEFRSTGSGNMPIRFDDQRRWTHTSTNIYFDHCKFNFCQVNSTHSVEGQGYDAFSKHGFWGCESIQDVAAVGIANVWMLGTATRWWFLFGCTVKCTSPKVWNDILDHWIYPGIEFHGLYKWNEFGPGNTMFAINGNQHGTGNEARKWHLISENLMHGTAGAIEFSVSQPGIENSSFDDTIVEGNLLYNHDTDNAISVVYCYGLTVRDNLCSHPVNSFVGIASARKGDIAFDVYRNKVYGASLTVATSGNAHRIQITDNTVWNTGSSALCMRVNSTDAAWTGQGSIIDRNQYYCPSDRDNKFNSANAGSTILSFANWQAAGFDMHGSQLSQAPNWPDPTKGNFGQ